MGKFRDRMDDELRLRGYSASTRECYVRGVHNFVRHFMRPRISSPWSTSASTSCT